MYRFQNTNDILKLSEFEVFHVSTELVFVLCVCGIIIAYAFFAFLIKYKEYTIDFI